MCVYPFFPCVCINTPFITQQTNDQDYVSDTGITISVCIRIVFRDQIFIYLLFLFFFPLLHYFLFNFNTETEKYFHCFFPNENNDGHAPAQRPS